MLEVSDVSGFESIRLFLGGCLRVSGQARDMEDRQDPRTKASTPPFFLSFFSSLLSLPVVLFSAVSPQTHSDFSTTPHNYPIPEGTDTI